LLHDYFVSGHISKVYRPPNLHVKADIDGNCVVPIVNEQAF